jgi:hypothetical protein
VVGDHILELSRIGRAASTVNSQLVLARGVLGVEPKHVGVEIVPQAKNENHVGQTPAHLSKTSLVLEAVKVVKDLTDIVTPSLSNGVATRSKEVLGIRKDDAILDVEALNLAESSTRREELGNNGDLLVGVDLEVATRAIVSLVALSPGVEVATIRVTVSGISVGRVCATAVVTVADVEGAVLARVGGISSRDGVGLPDVHLGAASTKFTDARVRVALGGVPSVNIGLATNELDVTGALAVAVAGSVLGSGLVVRLGGQTSVRVHGNEVKSAVQTAGKLGNIDVKGELIVEEVESLILGRRSRFHEVDTATDSVAERVLGNKLQVQLAA